MSQVGHANSKMTLDVYAQLAQRTPRDNGTGFDRLLAQARDTLDMPSCGGGLCKDRSVARWADLQAR
jgi:hypothetical protein